MIASVASRPNTFIDIFFVTIAVTAVTLASLGIVWPEPHPVLVLSFIFMIVSVIAVASRLNEFIVAFQERSRTRQPDYGRFQRYQAALDEFTRQQQEAERLAWLQEERWKKLDGWAFEKKLSELLSEQGWHVKVTKGSGDEGVDIVLKASGKTIIVQCKAHASLIHPGPVRELYGTLMHQRANEAWLVTTSGFSVGARTFAEGKSIRLLTMKDILRTPEVTSPS